MNMPYILPGDDQEKRKAVYKYVNDYQKEKYDRITVLRKAGDKKQIDQIAKDRGLSTSQFINQCIDEKLKRMKISLE